MGAVSRGGQPSGLNQPARLDSPGSPRGRLEAGDRHRLPERFIDGALIVEQRTRGVIWFGEMRICAFTTSRVACVYAGGRCIRLSAHASFLGCKLGADQSRRCCGAVIKLVRLRARSAPLANTSARCQGLTLLSNSSLTWEFRQDGFDCQEGR